MAENECIYNRLATIIVLSFYSSLLELVVLILQYRVLSCLTESIWDARQTTIKHFILNLVRKLSSIRRETQVLASQVRDKK